MKAIMTVTGKDRTGIVASVSSSLAERNINITNISQTIMDTYFTMILEVTFDAKSYPITQLQNEMTDLGNEERLEIRIQSTAIFDAMHRV